MKLSLFFGSPVRLVSFCLFVGLYFPANSGAQDTIAYYRFEEGEGTDVTNSVDGLVDGTTDGTFSADVVGVVGGEANNFSLAVGDATVAITDEPFVFHLDVCPTGNATVEFFFKAPTQPHASIFWTRPNLDGVDCERFSININDNPPGRVSGDYRKPDAQNCDAASTANNGIIPVDAWHHFAKVRTEQGDGSHLYEDYVDGVLHDVSTTISPPDTEHLPTTTEWSIGGRSGFSLDPGTLIDEVRLSCAALAPEDFLSVGGEPAPCPRDGDQLQDTHCTQIDVDPPSGSDAGLFTVFATGNDDSGDEVQYIFTADDGISTVDPVDQNGDIATFDLLDGFWTISVTVEDITPDSDLACDDAAEDNTCVVQDFLVIGAPPVADAWYRFEEGDGAIDLADSLSGALHGRSFASGPPNMGVAMFSLDVPGNPVIVGAGGDEELNEFSINLGTGFVVFNTLPFVFHGDAGCPNATLEFFFKAPDQEHAAIFWTQTNDATDRDRFAININPGGRVSGDYKTGGVSYSIANNSIIPANEWHHFAKVRTQMEDGSHLYEDYIDGELHEMSTTISPEDAAVLPTGTTWLINGRGGAFNLAPGTLIDEVRLTCAALGPDEFLRVPEVVLTCPRKGDDAQDTHCTVLDIDPPAGSPAGTFTLTATAEDTSGDDIFYTFTASDGNEEETVGPQLENTASLRLSEATWTISVTVEDITPDDDPDCEDAAADKVCTTENFEVAARPVVDAYAYYRFEEGDGVLVEDEVTGDVHGETFALYSADIPETGPNGESWNPIPFTGETNQFSMEIGSGIVTIDPIFLDGVPFVFHQDICPTGDATVEFFFKHPSQDHAAIFWTRPDDADSHRFGININPGGRVSGDYEGPDGRRHTIRNDGIIPVDEWHHFAKVRQELPDGSHVYSDYIDGVLWPTSTTVCPDLANNLPTEEIWRINGRGAGLDAGTIMDELRLSCEALLPGEFLIDPQTKQPVEICDDGQDNDEDGDVDCADADCVGDAACVEVCDDGEDNDADGDIDCADADCAGDAACAVGVGPFIRGDCDGNGTVGGSPTEAIVGLNFSFRGGPAPPCLAACDAEANGSLGVTDYLRILRFAFLGMGTPDAPFPDCTQSEIASDLELGCETPIVCQ